MRNAMLLLVTALLFSSPVSAQVPAGAEATAARLMQRIGPQTRDWIRQEAAREHAAGIASEAAARQAVSANPSLGNLAGSDVEALAFLVLMEASKSAQHDLKAITEQMKQINDAKASLRRDMQQTKSANAARDATARQGMAAQPQSGEIPQHSAVQPGPVPKQQFDRQLQAARNNADSLSELGDSQSLRLQTAMDRRSKLMSALSNLMKKLSDTKASLTQNLK